jgi:hypothetical protein
MSPPLTAGKPATYTVSAVQAGVIPYRIRVTAEDFDEVFAGTLISAIWDTTFFTWTQATDPREHLDTWRALAAGDTAVSAQVNRLSFSYGGGGPGTQPSLKTLASAALGNDHFGMIAHTNLTLSAGTWEFSTLSDDGIRVTVDGKPVIENWTWHVPTKNTGQLTLEREKSVEIKVEHFEIDGFAVLDLGIAPRN